MIIAISPLRVEKCPIAQIDTDDSNRSWIQPVNATDWAKRSAGVR